MNAGDRATIVLLAGGPATRLPGKLALDVAGEPMLARSFRRLTATGLPCVISARTPLAPEIAAALGDVSVVLDELADAGPLSGLLSAARRVQTPLLFAAAADMPNLSADFAERLVSAYDGARDRPDAVLPTWSDGHVEPLAALYDRSALIERAVAALRAGKRKVTAGLKGARVLAYRLGRADEDELLNVNTPADYERIAK
ncbi:MAG: molybdenum cofactor guanylyltransferase [Candidatus Eremiobacteraeota bacterium]|nr:molybdenum cofactor guanylyltransferase [Candidatus Eremiobacteraeota bacterium]MBV8366414.1 molybdenum cofactor guanylyltransferase [Candidatus Eremiobacteraeota bacterium]